MHCWAIARCLAAATVVAVVVATSAQTDHAIPAILMATAMSAETAATSADASAEVGLNGSRVRDEAQLVAVSPTVDCVGEEADVTSVPDKDKAATVAADRVERRAVAD